MTVLGSLKMMAGISFLKQSKTKEVDAGIEQPVLGWLAVEMVDR